MSSKMDMELDDVFDWNRSLRDMRSQLDAAGLQPRELGVSFEDLRVEVQGVAARYQSSLRGALRPSRMLEAIQSMRHGNHTRTILAGIEGTVRPGEMLLVLGRPGAGCSTLLKTLANQRSEYSAVQGSVHYDSISPAEIQKLHRGDVVYCPEEDVHFPSLSVEQTIQFAAKLRAPAGVGRSRAEYAETVTNALMTVLGLAGVSKTPVGNAALRGVSGGQKKRVSIAEILALRASIATWDNATRGLDSSTALEFIRALRTVTDVARMTTVVALYQAGESLYNLFDKVCVLYDGKLAYYGPRSEARQYFVSMGYTPANRQTTADFLVAVTDPNGRIPSLSSRSGPLPRNADEFAAYFQQSSIGEQNRVDIALFKKERTGDQTMADSYRASAKAEHSGGAGPYTTSLAIQAKEVTLRRFQILKGDTTATVMLMVSFIFQGIFLGTMFNKIGTATPSFFSRGGLMFFAILTQAIICMSEVPALFGQRPIVQRQSSWALYHPFMDQVALTLVDLPATFVSNMILCALIYEIPQLKQDASHFFFFFLICFAQAIVSKSWFRAMTALVPDAVIAQAFAGLSVLAYFLYTGYSIPPSSMVKGLKWVSYLNPLSFSFEAIMSHEFQSINGTCTNLVPAGPGYEDVSLANQVCTTVGAIPGQAYVDGSRYLRLSFGFEWDHAWRNFGFIIAFGVAFFIALLVFTELSVRIMRSHDIVLFRRSTSSAPIPQLRASGSDDIERESQSTKIDDRESADVIEEKPALQTSGTTDIFSWHHLNYTVPTADGPRQLLNDVSGYVAPGKLTALMGESGAGKTTLLNVLANRVDVGVVSGDRFVNGQALPKDFQSQTAYCQQQDTHFESSTVQEALLFSAKLRQPTSVPLAEKLAYVETCIQLCGLREYRDAAVGSLTIENKKRTTIAVELAAKPKLLLFLDEPTSGLDSQSAWNIVLFLRDLANAGQAILCTIHQPSAELFQMFDRLLLLRKGGETVYTGELGHNAETVIGYFQSGGGRLCVDGENPAEYMLDVIGAGATAVAGQDWHQTWEQSSEAAALQRDLDEICLRKMAASGSSDGAHTSTYSTSWANQVMQLVKRGFSGHNRNPSYLLSKFMLNIAAGLFIGLSFFNAKDTQQGAQNKLFSIFMSAIIAVPMANQVQLPFYYTREVYEIRERPSRMYSWTALVFSQVIIELPWSIVASTLYYLCWYWTIGFQNDRAGYTWLILCIFFPAYYTTVGQAFAAMTPNAEVGSMVFGALFSYVLSFNGITLPYSQLGWWKWTYRITPFTYFVEGFYGQLMGNSEIKCAPLEIVTLTPPSGQTCAEYMNPYISFAGGYLTDPSATSDCGFCSTSSSNEFMESHFNIHYSHRWRNLGIMAGFIFLNIAATFAFMWFFRIRSRSLMDMIRGRGKKA